MFAISYSARKARSVVKHPGPATIGKAIGKTVAERALSSLSLKSVMFKIISHKSFQVLGMARWEVYTEED